MAQDSRYINSERERLKLKIEPRLKERGIDLYSDEGRTLYDTAWTGYWGKVKSQRTLELRNRIVERGQDDTAFTDDDIFNAYLDTQEKHYGKTETLKKRLKDKEDYNRMGGGQKIVRGVVGGVKDMAILPFALAGGVGKSAYNAMTGESALEGFGEGYNAPYKFAGTPEYDNQSTAETVARFAGGALPLGIGAGLNAANIVKKGGANSKLSGWVSGHFLKNQGGKKALDVTKGVAVESGAAGLGGVVAHQAKENDVGVLGTLGATLLAGTAGGMGGAGAVNMSRVGIRTKQAVGLGMRRFFGAKTQAEVDIMTQIVEAVPGPTPEIRMAKLNSFIEEITGENGTKGIQTLARIVSEGVHKDDAKKVIVRIAKQYPEFKRLLREMDDRWDGLLKAREKALVGQGGLDIKKKVTGEEERITGKAEELKGTSEPATEKVGKDYRSVYAEGQAQYGAVKESGNAQYPSDVFHRAFDSISKNVDVADAGGEIGISSATAHSDHLKASMKGILKTAEDSVNAKGYMTSQSFHDIQKKIKGEADRFFKATKRAESDAMHVFSTEVDALIGGIAGKGATSAKPSVAGQGVASLGGKAQSLTTASEGTLAGVKATVSPPPAKASNPLLKVFEESKTPAQPKQSLSPEQRMRTERNMDSYLKAKNFHRLLNDENRLGLVKNWLDASSVKQLSTWVTGKGDVGLSKELMERKLIAIRAVVRRASHLEQKPLTREARAIANDNADNVLMGLARETNENMLEAAKSGGGTALKTAIDDANRMLNALHQRATKGNARAKTPKPMKAYKEAYDSIRIMRDYLRGNPDDIPKGDTVPKFLLRIAFKNKGASEIAFAEGIQTAFVKGGKDWAGMSKYVKTLPPEMQKAFKHVVLAKMANVNLTGEVDSVFSQTKSLEASFKSHETQIALIFNPDEIKALKSLTQDFDRKANIDALHPPLKAQDESDIFRGLLDAIYRYFQPVLSTEYAAFRFGTKAATLGGNVKRQAYKEHVLNLFLSDSEEFAKTLSRHKNAILKGAGLKETSESLAKSMNFIQKSLYHTRKGAGSVAGIPRTLTEEQE